MTMKDCCTHRKHDERKVKGTTKQFYVLAEIAFYLLTMIFVVLSVQPSLH